MTTTVSPPALEPVHAAQTDGLLRTIVGLEAFQFISSLGGALGLGFGFLDLKETTQDLPFQSPVLGGLALFTMVSLPALVAIIGVIRHEPWADRAHLVVGGLMMAWIVIQVAIVGLIAFLQPFMFTIGLAIALLAWARQRRA